MCSTVGPSLAVSLEPLPYCRNVVSLSLSMCIILVDNNLDWLNWFHFFIIEEGVFVIRKIFLSPFLDVTRMSMSTVSILAQLHFGILCL